ncbi:hypothetical protein [Polyangium sp. 15x6]|uniref:hypothetical protein n=1 Tax=Polyangium sp. 15x6 TaxID=3042687 RepID=UPI00249A98F2|nr:hypothetical protein [Polyangium sp. 15x6]MDI3286201.1 hypothetical protein [Polyangium sp. 15x6]
MAGLMAMTAGLLLFVACSDEGGSTSDGGGGTGANGGASSGGGGTGGTLAGAKKRCGQGVGCQPGETCELSYVEWGYKCSCEAGKLVCDAWSGGGAPPAGPPSDPGIECSDSYCPDNQFAASCSFASATCNYEVKCNLGAETTESITGECP